ncbi:MAG: hypothetical protein H7319_13250 [Spirosoma sp.]|nr:hypothetical protein [Spirosoma sp.]
MNTHKYGSFYAHLPVNQARVLSQKLTFHFTPKHGSWLDKADRKSSQHKEARKILDEQKKARRDERRKQRRG